MRAAWMGETRATRASVDRDMPAANHSRATQVQVCKLISGDFSIVENPVMTRSGEERLIEWHDTTMRNDAGQVVGTFSSGADITKRVRTMAALQGWEERTRLALEVTGVGLWDLDYATGTLRWSEVLEAQYG